MFFKIADFVRKNVRKNNLQQNKNEIKIDLLPLKKSARPSAEYAIIKQKERYVENILHYTLKGIKMADNLMKIQR